ncbi:putative transcription factor bHLH family [Lupinus albus]|uniref:Putative transcription factor bHLH family n=1 Tax=Lupinus albus TaxID=3870 RepID=A0A6A4Q572_LUPAL|nr:putative transcription factor bHLH family [Lupinus albus]
MDDSFSDIFEDREFGGDDLFAILESLEDFTTDFSPINETVIGSSTFIEETSRLVSQKSTSSSVQVQQHGSEETELVTSPKSKRQKVSPNTDTEEANQDGQQRISHITVERNRRKQMNEHLSVLRSLMPCFYVKRGDQASIIGGVVDYINELQQVLQALEAKKQRKVYTDVLSPRLVSSSPRPSPLSPRRPPLSPRLNLPISPRTPQPGSPYKPRLQPTGYTISQTISNSLEPSPTSSANSSINDNINELVANSKSPIADVEVKFSGPHLLLKTVSQRIPGQALKIMLALEEIALEILHVNISTADETMLNSFTIKVQIDNLISLILSTLFE